MRWYATLSMLMFALPLAAQTAPSGPPDRGSKILGGTAGVERTSSEGSTAFSFSVQPTLLFFVANRVALGGEVGLGYFDHENGNTTSWQIGPAARLYFGPSNAKTLPYVGAAVQFGSSNTSTDTPGAGDSESSGWRVEGVGGLTFMISRQVGVAGELVLQRDERTFDVGTTEVTNSLTRFALRFGVAAFIF
jgi:hypothetical protein